jgi:hypothetical protein
MQVGESMSLDVAGLGILFYSPEVMVAVAEGTDYLEDNYTTEEQVQSHIQRGTLVGFATGSPGRFALEFYEGYPNDEVLATSRYKLRLGLRCTGGVVYFRDLYDLLDWRHECPTEQQLQLEDGVYHVTLCSSLPASGILGDNQVIEFYLKKLSQFPALGKQGIPTLCMDFPSGTST